MTAQSMAHPFLCGHCGLVYDRPRLLLECLRQHEEDWRRLDEIRAMCGPTAGVPDLPHDQSHRRCQLCRSAGVPDPPRSRMGRWLLTVAAAVLIVAWAWWVDGVRWP